MWQDLLTFYPSVFLTAVRPKQWVKNGLVFLPLVFAINVVRDSDTSAPIPILALRLALVFLAFSVISSAVYLLNDLMDRRNDRLHPVKRNRPIASGKMGPRVAVAGIVLLSIGGLVAFAVSHPVLVGIGLIYMFMNTSYSLGLKRVVLLDVLLVTAGYVIRVTAGAVAIDVTPSPWLYATTAAGALFIVLGRRYAELRLAGDTAGNQRPVLREYGGPFIEQLLVIAATGAWLSYTLYAVEAESLPDNGSMLLTIPLVTFALFRYLYLLNTSQEAEAPEDLIRKDLPLITSILGWMAVSAVVLFLYG